MGFFLSVSLFRFFIIGFSLSARSEFSLSERAIALFGIPEQHVFKPVSRVHALW